MNKCLVLAHSHNNFFIIDHSFLSWRTIFYFILIFLDPLANYYITRYSRPINLIRQVKVIVVKIQDVDFVILDRKSTTRLVLRFDSNVRSLWHSWLNSNLIQYTSSGRWLNTCKGKWFIYTFFSILPLAINFGSWLCFIHLIQRIRVYKA